jgi:hypothetical protein
VSKDPKPVALEDEDDDDAPATPAVPKATKVAKATKDRARKCPSCDTVLDRGKFCPECGLQFDADANGSKDGGLGARVAQLEQRLTPFEKFAATLRGEGINLEETKPEDVRRVKTLGDAIKKGGIGGLGAVLGNGLRDLGFRFPGVTVPKAPPAAPPAPKVPPAAGGES